MKRILKLRRFSLLCKKKMGVIKKKSFLKKKLKNTHKSKKGLFHITFSRRNMFLVIAKLNNTIKVSTTLRKEGFFGRRRQQYVSIYDTIRFIKRLMRKVHINTIGLIYNG